MVQIEIDSGSGFCFGVTTAIRKAEEELAHGDKLYCLGDIVHNGMECDRLREMGLITIKHDEMRELHDVKVLLRAHGEPPETYELARRNHMVNVLRLSSSASEVMRRYSDSKVRRIRRLLSSRVSTR